MQQAILSALAVVFGLIGAGIFARRVNWLTEEADRTLIALVVRLLMPCLILREMNRANWFSNWTDLAIPPVTGFALIVLGFGVSAIVVRMIGKKIGLDSPAGLRTFVLCCGMFNYGYIPIPIVQELYPADPSMMPTLMLLNVGVETAMWTVGLSIIAGGLGRQWWTGLFNPVVLSIVAAVIIKLVISPFLVAHPLPYQEQVIGPIVRIVDLLASCAIPLSLLLTGATIADVWRQTNLSEGWGTTTLACVVRLIVLPAMFVALATLTSDVAMQRVIIIQAAMPAAIFPIVLARHYNGDAPTAVRVVIGTQLASLATIPLWLSFGLTR